MEIKLLVLRTNKSEELTEFYSLSGLTFAYHKHGKSPMHYSANIGQTIFEIYPLAKDQTEADKNLRLGFSIDNFDDTIKVLKERNTSFLLEPTQTEYGFMAIVSDPDKRKIKIYKQAK